MTHSGTPRISETEWEVMRAVWAGHPATAAEIIARLAQADPTWHPKTARTLIARLVKKRALSAHAEGRAYRYSPRLSEADGVAAASDSFLDRVFGGALKPMLVHFVEGRDLSRDEVRELEQLLARKRRQP